MKECKLSFTVAARGAVSTNMIQHHFHSIKHTKFWFCVCVCVCVKLHDFHIWEYVLCIVKVRMRLCSLLPLINFKWRCNEISCKKWVELWWWCVCVCVHACVCVHRTHTHPHCLWCHGVSCLCCCPLDGDIIQPNISNQASLPLGVPYWSAASDDGPKPGVEAFTAAGWLSYSHSGVRGHLEIQTRDSFWL